MKRLICFLITAVLLTVGVAADWGVQGTYSSLWQPEFMLDYKIDQFLKDGVMFNDCDNLLEDKTEIVANPNSSQFNMAKKTKVKTQGDGSIAFVKRNSALADLPIVIRSSNAVNLEDYSYLEFDLYMGGNWTFRTVIENPEYFTWIRFQDTWTNSVTDHTISSYDAFWDFDPYELHRNYWTHVRMPIPSNATGQCVQVTIHYGSQLMVGSKDEYIAIDNVRFTNDGADRELSLADKDGVMALKAEFDAMNADDQRDVTKQRVLKGWVKQIEEMEASLLTGDVDDNSEVNALDALMVLKSAVGKTTLTDLQTLVADVDKSGLIDAVDALEILKIAVGK
jgi:hypothetical protein